jgi:plasmid stabilization system protein ParE
MSFTYIFIDKAQEEYDDSVRWYALRSISAAVKFVEAVNTTLKLICENPRRWRNTFDKYHELGVKKFPFTIIYIIEPNNNHIVVTAIFHQKRNPKRRLRKLP